LEEIVIYQYVMKTVTGHCLIVTSKTVAVMNSDDLASRIKTVIGAESARSFAQRAGVSPSTLRSIMQGHRPNVDNLIAIADAAGVSLDWLAKGSGAIPPSVAANPAASTGSPAASPASMDEDLFGRIVEGIRQAYKNQGAGISDRDLGRLSARIYGDLSAAYDDPDERTIGLKMALQHLRRDLSKTPSDTADKRLA
jgi:transcriptional regulator with XRE-family HTH domain